jgi:hypothetical protein
MFDEEPDGDPHGECRAEISRLTAELAAARAVPADVEAAIDRLNYAAISLGATRSLADIEVIRAKDRDAARDKLKATIARAISEARGAPSTVGDPESEVRAWCVECDVDILNDGNSGERCDWLVFLYGEEDAREARDRAIDRLVDEGHAADAEAAERMVRIVPLVPFRSAIIEARAAAPSTVGGLLATARCSCTHEAGDSRCDAHPSCSECGAASARPVDGCEACRGPLPKGG